MEQVLVVCNGQTAQREVPELHRRLERATDRITTERLLRAFEAIVMYRSQIGGETSHQLTPLTDLQLRILNLMSLPSDLYAVLVPRPEFADTS